MADAETGLSLLGLRYYDSATGRFLNRNYNGRENLDTETGENKLDSTYHEKTTFT